MEEVISRNQEAIINPGQLMGFGQAYELLHPLMFRHGVTVSAEQFYWAVNRAFHAAEAVSYDSRHADMFQGLGPIWKTLFGSIAPECEKLLILDVGAGTGLVGEMLEQFMPMRVLKLTMLDPSPEMLGKARAKCARWSFPCEFFEGEIGFLRGSEKYHIVTVNSVLHHVVNLQSFFKQVSRLLLPGGWLFTAQDPRAELANDAQFQERREHALRRRHVSLAAHRIWRSLLRRMGCARGDSVADATNATLLQAGIINVPLDVRSIWSVTDFHVPGLPGDIGRGISVSEMAGWLTCLRLSCSLSYQYFGLPWDQLTERERVQSMAWWELHDAHGELFATAWKKVQS